MNLFVLIFSFRLQLLWATKNERQWLVDFCNCLIFGVLAPLTVSATSRQIWNQERLRKRGMLLRELPETRAQTSFGGWDRVPRLTTPTNLCLTTRSWTPLVTTCTHIGQHGKFTKLSQVMSSHATSGRRNFELLEQKGSTKSVAKECEKNTEASLIALLSQRQASVGVNRLSKLLDGENRSAFQIPKLDISMCVFEKNKWNKKMQLVLSLWLLMTSSKHEGGQVPVLSGSHNVYNSGTYTHLSQYGT